MKYYIDAQPKEEKSTSKKSLNTIASALVLVFSLCASAVLLFFISYEKIDMQPNDENNEYEAVFEESQWYDFLDFDIVEKEQKVGQVSDFATFKEENAER